MGDTLAGPENPGGREECVAVQRMPELWGLSGSPGECPGESGSPLESRKSGSPWESATNAVISAWKRPWFMALRAQ